MKKFLFLLLLLMIDVLFITANAQQNDSIHKSIVAKVNIGKLKQYRDNYYKKLPKYTSWVNDFDSIFSLTERKKIDSVITAFEKETGAQICVITLDTMCVAKEKFNDLVLHFANAWGVGQKIKNNGVTIGINKDYRLIRITNGFGVEKIFSNADTKELMDKYFIPNFKAGNYFTGTYSGVTALIKILKPKLKYLK